MPVGSRRVFCCSDVPSELGWYATVGDEAAQYAAPAMRPRRHATAAATARPSKGMKVLRTAGVSNDGVWVAPSQW